MGNKERLQVNNTDLQNILTTINSLPEGANKTGFLAEALLYYSDSYINGACVVIYGDAIHIMSNIHISIALDGSIYRSHRETPYNVAYGDAVVCNSRMYILGSEESADGKKFYVYDAAFDLWTKRSDIPFIHDGTSGAIVGSDGLLHVLGTYSENYEHYAYDTKSNTWTKQPDITQYLYNMRRCTFLDENNNICYVTRRGDVYRINPDTTNTYICGLEHCTIPEVEDIFEDSIVQWCNVFYDIQLRKLYFFGTDLTYYAGMWITYDFNNGEWESGRTINTLYAGMCYDENNKTFYLVQGYDAYKITEIKY